MLFVVWQAGGLTSDSEFIFILDTLATATQTPNCRLEEATRGLMRRISSECVCCWLNTKQCEVSE